MLPPPPPPPKRAPETPRPASAGAAGGVRRARLKAQLVDMFDLGNAGALTMGEMLGLAIVLGFKGTDAEWDTEFQKLCHENGAEPAAGLPREACMRLLDD
eukprot:2657891-Lingulodinium_polyedra.AAC.1